MGEFEVAAGFGKAFPPPDFVKEKHAATAFFGKGARLTRDGPPDALSGSANHGMVRFWID